MRFLVVGCGSIGKRHIRNLKALRVGDIIAHDVQPERCREVQQECGVEAHTKLEDALAQEPEIALICTPTRLHIPPALSAARSGCHLFIEKPLSHSLEDVDELVDIVTRKNLVTLVGCNLRFHPGIVMIKELLDKKSVGKVVCARVQTGQYLPDWHPWGDYRKGYSANCSLGGGAILDGIHELDYITWFLGKPSQVFCFSGRLSSLEIDTEDTAEVLLQLKSGAIVEVHLDYIQRSYGRSCQIIGEEGTILWDFNEKQVRFYSAKTGRWQAFPERFDYDMNDMYIEEMKHFLQCVEGKAKPMQDIAHAEKILEIALAAKESAATGKVISL
jgi:predicted dehydrogenase